MSSQTTDYLSAIKGLDEDFQSYAIIAFTFIILIVFIGYAHLLVPDLNVKFVTKYLPVDIN